MSISKLLLALLLVPALCSAARFEPPDFKGGEEWTYEISVTEGGLPVSQFQQDYSVLWKTKTGSLLTGQRKAHSNNAWAPGKDFEPSRCLVFIPDLTFDFGSEMCGREVDAGQQVQSESDFSRREIKFEGMSPASSPLGFFRAARFTVVDTLKGAGDSTAPTARQRLWEFLYVPELRAFSRMSLQFVDGDGVVVRTVRMKLISSTVRPAAN